MAASISKVRKKNIAAEFIKKTAGHIIGASGEYIAEAMPTVENFADEARRSLTQGIDLTRNAFSKVKTYKSTPVFRSLLNWYLDKANELDTDADIDAQLDFDITTDNEATVAQISETAKSSREISKSVIESSHKLVESQITSTANIVSAVEGLSSITTTGFERINSTLNDILKVVTKNTATMIETQVASSKSLDDILAGGKFNFGAYKRKIFKELENSPFGILTSFLGTAASSAKMMTPKDIMRMAFDSFGEKLFPVKALKNIDKTISDALVGSLIRIHGQGNNPITRALGNIFGIDTTRRAVSTSRPSLEVKEVAFDSITRESIVSAIPGYLRKILVAVGGEDVIYDNRSRSFKTQKAIRDKFNEVAATRGIASKAGRKFSDLGSYEELLLDLIANKEGWHPKGSGGSRIEFSKMLQSKDSIKTYMDDLLKDVDFSKSSKKDREKANRAFINRLYSLTTMEQEDLYNTIAKETINRKERIRSFIDEANQYDMDLSSINDSKQNDFNTILRMAGVKAKSHYRSKEETVSADYTHSALYEIYRRLDEGINVFQVGQSSVRDTPFTKLADDYLTPPPLYKAKPIKATGAKKTIFTYSSNSYLGKDEPEYDEKGEAKFTIDEKGRKVPVLRKRSAAEIATTWGKNFGNDFLSALFSGDPKRLQDVVLTSFKDFTSVSTKILGKGLEAANRKGGNVLGYLRHTITGRGYTYIDDEGLATKVKDNEKGGVVGYLNELIFGEGGVKAAAKSTFASTAKWFKSVAKYFDYSGRDPKEIKVQDKRRRLLGASVGALIGSKLGIIGGPLGIVLGAVAGNALTQSDGVGAKIKEFLFGSDEVDKDGNFTGRRKLGYINRAINWVVDPLRYQIGKTFTTFGAVLKKNILGPLSDLGFVIKERMASAVSNVTEKTFGPIIQGAKWLFQKALYLPLLTLVKSVTGTAIFKGNVMRGTANLAGGLFGGVVGTVANALARDDETKAALKARRQARATEVDIDKARSGYFGAYDVQESDEFMQLALAAKASGDMDAYRSNMAKAAELRRTGGSATKRSGRFRDYSTWKAQQNLKRMRVKDISEYTKETIEEKSPVAVATEEVAKNTADIASSNKELATLIQTNISEDSFTVRDIVLGEKIDKLAAAITGTPTPESSIRGESRRLSKEERKALKKKYLAQYKDQSKAESLSSEVEEDIADRAVGLTESIMSVTMNPFVWLSKALGAGFRVGYKAIISPILNLGGFIKTAVIGGEAPDGSKVEGLIPMAFNNTIGVLFKQIGNTFSTVSKSLTYNIIDPISDILWVAKEKTKKSISSFLFGVKDKSGKWVNRGLLTPITEALDSSKKWIRDKVTGFFNSIFTPVTKLIGGLIKAPIAAPFALLRMMATAGSAEGRANIGNQWKDTVGSQKGFGKLTGFFDFLTIAGSKSQFGNSSLAKLIMDEDIRDRLSDRQKKRSLRRGIPITSVERLSPSEVRRNEEAQRRQEIATAISGAIISGAASQGVSRDESQVGLAVVSDAIKGKSTNQSIISNVKKFFNSNRDAKSDGEEKTPWWKKLLGGIGGILTNWKAWLAGGALALLFNKNFRELAGGAFSLIKEIGGRIFESIGNIWKWIKGDATGDKNALNVLTAPFDMKTDSTLDYVTPEILGGEVNHVATDAAGGNIKNQIATNAKDRPYWEIARNSLTGMFKKGAALANGENPATISLLSKGGKKLVRGMTRIAKGAIIGNTAGNWMDTAIANISKKLGFKDEDSEMAGRIANVTTQAIVTTGAIRNKGIGAKAVNYIDEFIKRIGSVLKYLGVKLASVFPQLKGITKFLDGLLKKLTVAAVKPFAHMIPAKMGKETFKAGLAGYTYGISIAAFASIGTLLGGFNTSNLFMVPPEEADGLMLTIASGLGAVFEGIPYVGLVEIFDLVLGSIGEKKGLRQLIAEFIYKEITGINDFEVKRADVNRRLKEYNEKHETQLTYTEFYHMIYPSATDELWSGTAHIRDDGGVDRRGGIKQTITGWFSQEQANKNALDAANTKAEESAKVLTNLEMWKLEKKRIESRGRGEKFDTDKLSDTEKKMLAKIDNMTDAQYNENFNTAVTGSVNVQSPNRYRTEGTKSETESFAETKRNDDYGMRPSGHGTGLGFTKFKTEEELREEHRINEAKLRQRKGVTEFWELENKRKAAMAEGRVYEYANDRERFMGEQIDSWDDEFYNDFFKQVYGWSIFSSASDKRYKAPTASVNVGGPEETESSSNTEGVTKGKLPSPYIGGSYRISSPYGPRVLKGKAGFHGGMDLVGSSKKIGAVAEGTVTRVVRGETRNARQGGRSYGNLVEYKTPDGYTFLNAHMRAGSIPANMGPGTKVSPGDYIGTEGDTGHSYGSHLHFEVRHPSGKGNKNSTINPAPFLSGTPLTDTGKFSPGGTAVESSNTEIAASISGESPGGMISKFLEAIKTAGNRFLYHITGGLIGSKDDNAEGSSFSSSFTKPEPALLLTNEEVRKLGLKAGIAEILDLKSGITYRIHWEAPGNHSEYTTLTEEDTVAKKKTVGEWSWIARPVLLKIQGKTLACGTNSYPHGKVYGTEKSGLTDSKKPPQGNKWELGGHFCLWYKDSVSNHPANMGESYAESMRKAAKEAFELSRKLSGDTVGTPGYISGGSDNESKIYDFFSSKGLSPASIAAIMGTIAQESNFDPKAVQKTAKGEGKGRGLFQWEVGGRFEQLKKFAQERGTNWDDLQTQLEFAWQELQNHDYYFRKGVEKNWKRKGIEPYKDGLKGFFADQDVEHAAKAFDAAFTRSADAYQGYTENGTPYRFAGHLEKRVAKAKAAFQKWSAIAASNKQTASIASTPPKADGIGGPNVSDIIQERFRDKSLDDDEGGIGGPLDIFDSVLGTAHSVASSLGHGDKMKGVPKSTGDIFSSLTRELNIPKDMRIPTSPEGILGMAHSAIGKLPLGEVSKSFENELKKATGRASQIKLPEFLGKDATMGDILSQTASKLRLPNFVDELPKQLPPISGSTSQTFRPTSPQMTEIDNLAHSIETSMNMGTVESLLASVLQELKSINGNTATNSDLMYAINENSVASSKMTKDTIKAMAKSSKRQPHMEPKKKDINAVGAIIRGV